MSFSKRVNKGSQWQEQLQTKLEQYKFKVVYNGLEHTHHLFHSILNNYKKCDTTSKWVRYQPDGLVTLQEKEKTCFIEAKASNSIEKDAYLVYKKIYDIGCKLLICILDKYNNEYYIPIEKLRLIDSKKYIKSMKKRFPKTFIELPIDSDGWLAPRLCNPNKYRYYKNKTGGSGTSHKYFNFKNMKKFQKWSKNINLVIEWLENNKKSKKKINENKTNITLDDF